MKNKNFIFKSQINNSIYNLWSTELFKKLHNEENSVIKLLVENLKDRPFTLFDYTSDIERHHMTLWFYHLGRREYENKYIQDLYYFHELYHLASFPNYISNDFEDFKNKMWINELEASLMSEVFIYYFIPELRNKTFNHRIWFDDLIEMFHYEKIDCNQDIFTFKNLPKIFDKIKDRRIKLRNNLDTELETENWIKSFNSKDEWFEYWRSSFKEVENIRVSYENMAKYNDYYAFVSLEENLKNETKNEIPFFEIANNTSK